MIKRFWPLFASLMLAACNDVTPPAPTPDPSTDVSSFIDSNIVGQERDDISAFIRSLPSNLKLSNDIGVILIDAGTQTFAANRVSLRNVLAFSNGDNVAFADLPRNHTSYHKAHMFQIV